MEIFAIAAVGAWLWTRRPSSPPENVDIVNLDTEVKKRTRDVLEETRLDLEKRLEEVQKRDDTRFKDLQEKWESWTRSQPPEVKREEIPEAVSEVVLPVIEEN